ncbi:FHA domain-containing protein [Streptacidiphilus fuscans]|uniref:FHA domain-containing protein n=1 Tax=Streptacidiphilus fuscans TaxID=2789292 RepID=A0A931FFM3_9ACTN|nr:FHA domain-containing protein [Streptacidiphilus fuscans]MBF9070430.1 FHA domain-containing protein [Streptacidiphilus fuscans]
MPICPHGHQSQTADYCDFCGMPMGAPPVQQAPHAMPGGQPGPGAPTPTAGLPMCPICSTPRTGQYCEECGYNWDLAPAGTGGGMQQPPAHGPQVPPPPGPGPGPQPAGFRDPGFQAPGAQVTNQPPYPGPQMTPPPVPQPPVPTPEGQSGGGFGGGYGNYVTGDTSGGAGTEYFLAPPQGPGQPGPGQPDPDYGQGFGQDYGQPQPGPGAAPVPAPPARRGTWIAVVTADREYFNDMMARSGPEASGLYFPPFSPERRVPMTGQGQLRIGRRSHQRGTVPEIDLSIAPEDPGASHQHALLQEQPDGSWVVIDQDSTNGTTLNGAAESLSPFVPVELHDGDRIHVGAWTTITVHCA